MKKIKEVLGGHKDEAATEKTTSTTTTTTMPETEVPDTYIERKVITEEPLRHESVSGGVKETLKHPVEALRGQPRDRSPTEVRRSEYVERIPVYREGGREGMTKSMEGLSLSEKERRSRIPPKPAYEIREESSTLESERFIEEQQTVLVEKRERGAIIKEHIHPQEREEIQPVIHRERERTEVIQFSKPILEKDILPTKVEERTLPAETRPTVVQGESEEFRRRYNEKSSRFQSSTEVAPIEREVFERPPIIKEHITRKVIQEVQPVIYREITEPHVIKEVRPIYEKVVEGPVIVESRDLPMEEHYQVHRTHKVEKGLEPTTAYEYREVRREPVQREVRREFIRESPTRREPEYVVRESPTSREAEYYKREAQYVREGQLERESSIRTGEVVYEYRDLPREEYPLKRAQYTEKSRQSETRG